MRARGFTLVEVMVALAIVAIALPAVLVSLYRQIDDTAYLRDKTMAGMVAANKLAEMRLVIASTRVLMPGKANGVTPMAEREWHWWVETKVNNPQLPKFLRIEIRVALEKEQGEQPPENPLYTLTMFMSNDLRVEAAAPAYPVKTVQHRRAMTPVQTSRRPARITRQDSCRDPTPMSKKRPAGFTLVEVLIALAITAFVAMIAYTGLTTVMTGVERLRDNSDRIYEINRAFMILSRDLRQFTDRPVRDEFGELEPAFTGGELARFELSFTRSGWFNPNSYPRSTLQRVNYRLEDEGLWRDTYPVLDRAADTEPESVLLLDGVESLQLKFLGSLESLQIESDGATLDTRNWVENWVSDGSGQQSAVLTPPAALEMTLQLKGWGEMKRLYALPPL